VRLASPQRLAVERGIADRPGESKRPLSYFLSLHRSRDNAQASSVWPAPWSHEMLGPRRVHLGTERLRHRQSLGLIVETDDAGAESNCCMHRVHGDRLSQTTDDEHPCAGPLLEMTFHEA
jgi:hypothetical protein